MFFIALGVVLLSMSLYRSPAVALMPDLTPKPLRSKANAIINLMGAVGAIFSLMMMTILIPKIDNPSYFYVFLTIGILMVSAVVVLLLTIKENKLSKEMQSLNDKQDEEEKFTKGDNGDKMPQDVKKSLYFILASIFLWFTAYNAVTTAFSRYATKVWNLQGGGFANALLVATGAAILSYIPIEIGRASCRERV